MNIKYTSLFETYTARLYAEATLAEHGKRNNVERLFKDEAYRPYRLRY
ncbi:MAG: hypothetical protein LBH59_04240 [Planctomycetaceae bacterium]|jgi:hypothetical protein|nr:hypothetical protein [Planctomycetaceae bacterium]